MAAPTEIVIDKDLVGQRFVKVTVGGNDYVYPGPGLAEIALKHLIEYPDDADLPVTLT